MRDVCERYHEAVQELRRITIDPAVMGGQPCVRGMRVTVGNFQRRFEFIIYSKPHVHWQSGRIYRGR